MSVSMVLAQLSTSPTSLRLLLKLSMSWRNSHHYYHHHYHYHHHHLEPGCRLLGEVGRVEMQLFSLRVESFLIEICLQVRVKIEDLEDERSLST